MVGPGRPKLDSLEKALRKGRRLKAKIQQLELLYQSDPLGPPAPSRPGRPPISYETQLKRTMAEYRELKSEIKHLAQDKGLAVKSVEAWIRQTEDPALSGKVGRPAATYVVALEYKIRQKLARIDRIRSGREAKDLLERRQKLIGQRRRSGRKPIDEAKKIARLEDQVLAMRAEVRAHEQSMTTREREQLKIHRMRRHASNLRKALRSNGLDELRLQALDNWAVAKSEHRKYPDEVLECCALELAVDELVRKHSSIES